jgi:Ca2+-binding EF-hand superfamily protein
MRTIGIFFLVPIIIIGTVSITRSAGPSDERFRSAYRQILSQTDTNKDGKLSVTECKAIYKDKIMAEKNCNFWDVNGDGIITEDEYVQQVWSLGEKK